MRNDPRISLCCHIVKYKSDEFISFTRWWEKNYCLIPHFTLDLSRINQTSFREEWLKSPATVVLNNLLHKNQDLIFCEKN